MIKSNRSKYLIEVDLKNKILNIKLSGFFRIKEAEGFAIQLYENTSKIKTRCEYAIIIDCREISIFKHEILKVLEESWRKCREYENIVFINPISLLPRMQIQGIVNRYVEFSRSIFVDSIEDAYLYMGRNIIKEDKSEITYSDTTHSNQSTNNIYLDYFCDILKKNNITRN